MEFLINGVFVDESEVTPEQWEDIYEKDMEAQCEATHVDPMELEEPTLDVEGGFDREYPGWGFEPAQEFLKECD